MEATSVGELIFGALVLAAFIYGILKFTKKSSGKKGGSGGGSGTNQPPKQPK